MSWFSDLFGGRKIKTPKVKKAEEFDFDREWAVEDYLRRQARKSGFAKTILTGLKKPKLAAGSYLGAVR